MTTDAPVLRLLTGTGIEGQAVVVPIYADQVADLVDLVGPPPVQPPPGERIPTRPGELEIPIGRWLRISVLHDDDGEAVVRRDHDGLSVMIVACWPTDDTGAVLAHEVRRGMVRVLPLRLDDRASAVLQSIADRFPAPRHDYRISLEGGLLRVRPCAETLVQVPGIDVRRQGDRVRRRIASEK